MNKFEKKQQEVEALKNCYDSIERLVNNEIDYNQYVPDGEDTLSEWQIQANEQSNYRVSVYRKIQEYIEKML